MAKDIGEWYLDAEGKHSDRPGLDWENDDRVDRNPDAWLDRLPQVTPAPPPPPRKPKGKSRRSRSKAAAPRGKQRRQEPAARAEPTSLPAPDFGVNGRRADFADVIRRLWSKSPEFGAAELTALAHAKGWTMFDRADVAAILKSLDPPKTAKPSSVRRTARAPKGTPHGRRKAPKRAEPAAPQPRSEICPSCGVAVSHLGLCACS